VDVPTGDFLEGSEAQPEVVANERLIGGLSMILRSMYPRVKTRIAGHIRLKRTLKRILSYASG